MTAEIHWNPHHRTITLLLSDTYTLDEFQQVNTLIGAICNEPGFDYAYLIVHMENVQRPTFSTSEARQHTNHFRDNNLRRMYVSGLNRAFQFVGNAFRPAIEAAVGMPLKFVNTVAEAKQDIAAEDPALSH